MNSVKNLSFPKRDQPKPTEKKLAKKLLGRKVESQQIRKAWALQRQPSSTREQVRSRPTSDSGLTCQIAEMLARLLGMGFDCCPHLRWAFRWWIDMIDDCFKIPWLFFLGFREGMKNYTQLWKVRGFFIPSHFASQLCTPFRFCCWLFSISWMRISECLKKYSFGMDISWLCIKCWYLDSFSS